MLDVMGHFRMPAMQPRIGCVAPQRPRPGRHFSHAIAVYEAEPYWVPELQRRLSGEGVAVQLCSRISDAVAAHPDVTVVRWSGSDRSVSDPLGLMSIREGATAFIVGLPESMIDAEWVLRDLGATAVLEETCGGERLAAICRRILHANRHETFELAE
jgi:hypothetical protein